MTQEKRQLLVKDICARMPHGLKVLYDNSLVCQLSGLIKVNGRACFTAFGVAMPLELDKIKLYLRPMSSMTEEERKELFEAIGKDMRLLEETLDKEPLFRCGDGSYYGNPIHYELDFLISHQFDYQDLIPTGLALEAKEGMYKF